jgi:hypothetical protein
MQAMYRFRRWPLLVHVIQPAPQCYSANASRLIGVLWIVLGRPRCLKVPSPSHVTTRFVPLGDIIAVRLDRSNKHSE